MPPAAILHPDPHAIIATPNPARNPLTFCHSERSKESHYLLPHRTQQGISFPFATPSKAVKSFILPACHSSEQSEQSHPFHPHHSLQTLHTIKKGRSSEQPFLNQIISIIISFLSEEYKAHPIANLPIGGLLLCSYFYCLYLFVQNVLQPTHHCCCCYNLFWSRH